MRHRLIAFLLGLVLVANVVPAFAGGDVFVNGYKKRDGTYVAPHWRSAPDGDRSNNWSTRGNVNPYTGQSGTRSPYDSGSGSSFGGFGSGNSSFGGYGNTGSPYAPRSR